MSLRAWCLGDLPWDLSADSTETHEHQPQNHSVLTWNVNIQAQLQLETVSSDIQSLQNRQDGHISLILNFVEGEEREWEGKEEREW